LFGEHRKVVAFSGILLGMMSSVLMQTIVATVLPIVTKDLGDVDLYGWVFSSYMIASTISIPLFSKLADLYGRKPLYLYGLTLFLIGSALSGSAHSMGHLIASRILQGLGAGAVAPSALALISDLFSNEERGRWLGFLAVAQVLANVTGPLVGGVIADSWGWHWAFYANLPLGLLALLMVSIGLNHKVNRMSGNWRSMDILGALLLGIFTVLFILGSQELRKYALLSWQSALFILASVTIFVILLRQEKMHPDPIISAHLLRTTNIIPVLQITLLFGALMYGIIMILPLYGQLIFGQSAWQGGKLLIPLTLGLGIGGILVSPMNKRLDYARLVVFEWSITFCGFALLWAASQIQLSESVLMVIIFIIGLGLGGVFPTLLLISQNVVSQNQRAVTGGLVQLARNIGGAIGVPVFTNFVTLKEVYGTSFGQPGFAFVYLLLMVGAGLALIIGFRFKGGSKKTNRVITVK
jgi:EmrB/QacA subfamily drug resistance transporter